MTTRQIKLITLLIFLADVPLTLGDKFVKLPLPGYITSAWPAILIIAGIVDRALHIYFDPAIQPQPPVQPVNVNIDTQPKPEPVTLSSEGLKS